MCKRWTCNFLVFTLMLSVIVVLNGCAKKVIKEEKVIGQEEEIAKAEEALQVQRERDEAAINEEVTKREARLRREFENDNIHFDFDRFSLTDKAKEILAKNASWLLDNPIVKIEIEGHCDQRGTNEYNMALGERRANSVMKYLIFSGVKAERISTISYGEERPIDLRNNEAAWTKNRRAHFRVVLD